MTTACLGDPGALPRNPPDELIEELRVRDAASARWPPAAMPRSPTFELAFDRPPTRADARLWLVAGAASLDVLEDLADPPLRAATLRTLVPLRVETRGSNVTASPEAPLAPGARYELVWTRGEEPPDRVRVRVSESPAAGAALAQSWPGDRDVRVPPNAQRLLLRYDGYVGGVLRAAIALTDEAGHLVDATVSVAPCSALALPPGDCVAIALKAPLAPNRAYALTLGEGLLDATGAPLAPHTLAFATSGTNDDSPPQLTAIQCGLDELVHELGCVLPRRDGVLLRGHSEEPALVTLVTGAARVATLALTGAFALPLRGLPPGGSAAATLQVEDLAGQRTEHSLTLASALGLATVRMDELRPDPLGPEPAQEYVELLNFGSDPVQIMGFSLTDDAFDRGRSIVTPLMVEPGERVLVVGPEFDPGEPSDGPLPSGVRIARLDGALSLRNDGEALFLRDELGRRLDQTERVAPASPGQCVGIVGAEAGAPALVTDPAGGCTPGAATLDPWQAAAEASEARP